MSQNKHETNKNNYVRTNTHTHARWQSHWIYIRIAVAATSLIWTTPTTLYISIIPILPPHLLLIFPFSFIRRTHIQQMRKNIYLCRHTLLCSLTNTRITRSGNSIGTPSETTNTNTHTHKKKEVLKAQHRDKKANKKEEEDMNIILIKLLIS